MQALEVIHRLNAEATERDIPSQQAAGNYVVAHYSGLNYTGHSVHATEAEANAEACRIGNQPGQRAVVHPPVNS